MKHTLYIAGFWLFAAGLASVPAWFEPERPSPLACYRSDVQQMCCPAACATKRSAYYDKADAVLELRAQSWLQPQ